MPKKADNTIEDTTQDSAAATNTAADAPKEPEQADKANADGYDAVTHALSNFEGFIAKLPQELKAEAARLHLQFTTLFEGGK